MLGSPYGHPYCYRTTPPRFLLRPVVHTADVSSTAKRGHPRNSMTPHPSSFRLVRVVRQHPPLCNAIREPPLVDKNRTRPSSTGGNALTLPLNDDCSAQRSDRSTGDLDQLSNVVIRNIQVAAPANGKPNERGLGRGRRRTCSRHTRKHPRHVRTTRLPGAGVNRIQHPGVTDDPAPA